MFQPGCLSFFPSSLHVNSGKRREKHRERRRGGDPFTPLLLLRLGFNLKLSCLEARRREKRERVVRGRPPEKKEAKEEEEEEKEEEEEEKEEEEEEKKEEGPPTPHNLSKQAFFFTRLHSVLTNPRRKRERGERDGKDCFIMPKVLLLPLKKKSQEKEEKNTEKNKQKFREKEVRYAIHFPHSQNLDLCF